MEMVERQVTKDRILVQGAMEAEVEKILLALEDVETKTIGAHTFYEGLLCVDEQVLDSGNVVKKYATVIVVRTYIGMINTASATVLAATNLAPTAVINQGVAGGHHPDLKKGDLIIGTEAVNISAVVTNVKGKDEAHDFSAVEQRDTEVPLSQSGREKIESVAVMTGVKEGFSVDEKAPNIDVCRYEKITDEDFPYEMPTPIVVKQFKSDEAWVEAARQAAQYATNPAKAKEAGISVVPYTAGKIVEGFMGSADTWNRELSEIFAIHERLGTFAEEMEGVAAAQVCKSYGIPFLSVRNLSNSEWSGEDYDPRMAAECQMFVLEIIKEFCRRN